VDSKNIHDMNNMEHGFDHPRLCWIVAIDRAQPLVASGPQSAQHPADGSDARRLSLVFVDALTGAPMFSITGGSLPAS
jgi:hypothetical protein